MVLPLEGVFILDGASRQLQGFAGVMDGNGDRVYLALEVKTDGLNRGRRPISESLPGFFFMTAKYGGRTYGWCIYNQPPITGSPSVFCSQKKESWSLLGVDIKCQHNQTAHCNGLDLIEVGIM
jgi:hypothetical protein